jgi:hypothetical protein
MTAPTKSPATSSPTDRERSAEASAVGVVVLGVGRSGTSAITRAFVSAGFFAGRKDEVVGPLPSNPLGHYEPLSVLEANEELLESLDSSWWGDLPETERQVAQRAAAVPRLNRVVDSLLAAAEGAPIAVKEPRVNALLPLWEPVIERDGRELHPVLAIRNPIEIAKSYATRDGLSIPHMIAAWEVQTTLLLDWLDDRTVTVAPYGKLMTDPALVAGMVQDATSHLEASHAKRIRPEDTREALRPGLRHESAGRLAQAEYLTGRQAELWRFLDELPGGDVRLQAPPHLRHPSDAALAATGKKTEWVRFADEHAKVCARLSELNDQVSALERDVAEAAEAASRYSDEIARIEASLSWRLTAPLRRLRR